MPWPIALTLMTVSRCELKAIAHLTGVNSLTGVEMQAHTAAFWHSLRTGRWVLCQCYVMYKVPTVLCSVLSAPKYSPQDMLSFQGTR